MKRILILAIVVVLLLALLAVPALAAPKSSVIVVPRDYATIQQAIDEASSGDKIIVQAGTYAGATVNKAVELVGTSAVIEGPEGTWLGFYILGEGSGATIRGFKLVGLCLPIYGNGANDVTIEHNVILDSMQAITNYNGSGWNISHNEIEGLWAVYPPGYGGIGILISAWLSSGANSNRVAYNKISADVTKGTELPYTRPGIYLDSEGGPAKNNTVVHNTSVVTGWSGDEPVGVGFEIDDFPLAAGGEAMVTGNIIGFNDFRGSTIEMYVYPDEAEANNIISRNLGENCGHGVTPANPFR
ncbi:right-handed parallel beta-helix repeat-containing protein [Chloroflexota bacterium]